MISSILNFYIAFINILITSVIILSCYFVLYFLYNTISTPIARFRLSTKHIEIYPLNFYNKNETTIKNQLKLYHTINHEIGHFIFFQMTKKGVINYYKNVYLKSDKKPILDLNTNLCLEEHFADRYSKYVSLLYDFYIVNKDLNNFNYKFKEILEKSYYFNKEELDYFSNEKFKQFLI